MLTESARLGGAEVMICNLTSALQRHGHEVGAVVPSNGGEWLASKLTRLGVPMWDFKLGGGVNGDLWDSISKAVREFRPTVMHSHLWVMAAYGGLIARRHRVPHVITMHGGREETQYLRRRIALRWSFKRARAVVPVSVAMRSDLSTDLGIPEARFQVVENGSSLDTGDRISTRNSLGLPASTLTILSIGSQGPRKNHVSVLRAAAQHCADLDWAYVLAGPYGESTEDLARTATELGVSNRFTNLGPRDDVADLLACADAFAMPSTWEGMPVALVEAMGAGLPIVASQIGGMPDMIANGVDGLLVKDPMNVDDLGRALRRLLVDRALAAALGRSAASKARERYSVDSMTARYLELYLG